MVVTDNGFALKLHCICWLTFVDCDTLEEVSGQGGQGRSACVVCCLVEVRGMLSSTKEIGAKLVAFFVCCYLCFCPLST